MRIDTPLTVLKTQDLTPDRSRDMRAQSLNPNSLAQDSETIRNDELTKTQGPDEAEFAGIDPNRQQDSGEEPEQEEEETPQEDPRAIRLREEAAERLLSLPVNNGKFARREEHRIDVKL
jgi:hypothetical protein